MENLFLTILSISLTTSIIIIVLVMLGSLLNKRYAAKWKYGLWIALALRLLIPVNYTIPDSNFQITVPDEVGSLTVSDIFETEDEVVGVQPADSEMEEAQTVEPQTVIPLPVEVDIPQKAKSAFSLMQALSYLWAAGAACLLICQLTGFFYCKRKILKKGKAVENPILTEQMFEVREGLGIRTDVALLIYENASSPMIIGFWRPVLVLPGEDYTPQESYYILKHELIHLRRHDVLIKFLLMLSRDIHWFNPVVYLMQKEAVVDMELACDEAVVRGASFDQREAYTETLMSMLHGTQRRGPLLSTQFSGGVRIMKKRFRNILSKANKKNGVILFSVILIMTVIIGTMVGCSMEQSVPETSEEITGRNTADGELLGLSVGAEEILSLSAEKTNDKSNAMTALAETQKSRETSTVLTVMKEGMPEEKPATLYKGEGYSFYVIDGDWDDSRSDTWRAKVNDQVTFYVRSYEGLNKSQIEGILVAQGYTVADRELWKLEDDTMYKTRCYETDRDVWTINSVYPQEAEGWGADIMAMADTFAVEAGYDVGAHTELSRQDAELINMGIHNNEHNVYMGTIVKEEMRMIITRTEDSLSAAYITRDDEEKVFKGELKKDSAGFILNTDSGEYLKGSIRAEDNGGIFIYGEGVISGKEVAFTLCQDTFFPIDEDTENYYSSLGYDAKAVEQFAKQIKDSINDKTAFAKLISYPISIEIDGSSISIENEEEMLDVYDKLIEQKGFKQQIESIYTKYMFANYMGICVEDGIMWIQQDSSGDYKIYEINVPERNKEIEDIVNAFASAYFNADIDAIQNYLVNPYEWDIDAYDNPNQADEVNIIGIKGIPDNLAGNNGDECVASLEFSNPGEDSLTYLTIELVKDEDSWKVKFYGLEK